MSEFMSDTWANFKSEGLYVHWPGGIAEGIFAHQGVFDSSPAIETFNNILSPFGAFSDRTFVISSGNADTGNYEVFTKERIPFEDLHYIMIASGSIPVIFPNLHYKGMNLMDGCTVWDINLVSAID